MINEFTINDPEDVSARLAIWSEDCKVIGYKLELTVKCPYCAALQLDPARLICGNKLCAQPVGPGKWMPGGWTPPQTLPYLNRLADKKARRPEPVTTNEDELFGF